MTTVRCTMVSRLAAGFLGGGVALVVLAALQAGPGANEATAAVWLTYAGGILALLVSLVLCNIEVSLRETSWSEAGVLALIGASLFGVSVIWLIPVTGQPVIFHPAVATELIGLLWFLSAVVCAFRAANR